MVIWLTQMGAISVVGNLVVDDGGDVVEVDFVRDKDGYRYTLN